MKLIATRKAHQNRRGVDPWTVVHFASGLALGLVGTPFRSAFAVGALYEIVKQAVERHEEGQRFFKTSGPEGALNVAIDMAALAAGHRLGVWWNET